MVPGKLPAKLFMPLESPLRSAFPGHTRPRPVSSPSKSSCSSKVEEEQEVALVTQQMLYYQLRKND